MSSLKIPDQKFSKAMHWHIACAYHVSNVHRDDIACITSAVYILCTKLRWLRALKYQSIRHIKMVCWLHFHFWITPMNCAVHPHHLNTATENTRLWLYTFNSIRVFGVIIFVLIKLLNYNIGMVQVPEIYQLIVRRLQW